MNPKLIHPTGNEANCYLVDFHSVAKSRKYHGRSKLKIKEGEVATVFLKAIDIRNLRAGEMNSDEGKIYPRPCQLIATDKWKINSPMWRGIYPDAAEALLDMSHGMDTSVSPGKNFELCKDAAGWNEWHFLTAWGWSLWQAKHRSGDKWPLARRWEAMKGAGYPDTEGAFRQICSRLKLSVTKSRPIM
ncbi:MAG: hypothetical protein ACSHX9_02130 [Luteolibacter sp.]